MRTKAVTTKMISRVRAMKIVVLAAPFELKITDTAAHANAMPGIIKHIDTLIRAKALIIDVPP